MWTLFALNINGCFAKVLHGSASSTDPRFRYPIYIDCNPTLLAQIDLISDDVPAHQLTIPRGMYRQYKYVFTITEGILFSFPFSLIVSYNYYNDQEALGEYPCLIASFMAIYF